MFRIRTYSKWFGGTKLNPILALLLLALLRMVSLANPALEEKGMVIIAVIDQDDERIEDVIISTRETYWQKQCITNEDGSCIFEHNAGVYDIKAEKDGYQTNEIQIEVFKSRRNSETLTIVDLQKLSQLEQLARSAIESKNYQEAIQTIDRLILIYKLTGDEVKLEEYKKLREKLERRQGPSIEIFIDDIDTMLFKEDIDTIRILLNL